MKNFFLFLSITFLFTSVLWSQPKIKIEVQPERTAVQKGDTFLIKVNFDVPSPWNTYPAKEQLGKDSVGPTPTEFSFKPDVLKIAGKIKSSKPHRHYDEGFEMDLDYYAGKFNFTIPVVAKKDIDFSKNKVQLLSYMQFCNETGCIPPDDYSAVISSVAFASSAVQVEDTAEILPSPVDSGMLQQVTEKVDKDNKVQMTESQREIEQKKSEGALSFLWFAISAGALALLTPCVFPMIPITVSFFTKRSEKGKGRAVRDALFYAIGIILTFTGLGIILALIFGATGIRDFATNGWINLFITAIFIVFALNLFGAFEIALPSGLMNKLDRKSSSSGGIVSVLLMALTFSITSFTCTVPFVGSTLVAASGGEWFYPILGMLGFSGVFAAPFFLLALFPAAMKKLPKSGGWLNNVKVVMGFVEIAAAMKFLSNADLVWNWGIMPKELFIAIWIIICFLIVVYVLGLFRLPHDSEVKGVGAVRIIWAMFFGAVGFYLLTGLFGKTLGELDAFMPPSEYREIMNAEAVQSASTTLPPAAENESGEELVWLDNYELGLQKAKETGMPLFIDFTGFTCTNCRWMEQNMFKRSEIHNRMSQFVLVRLFTDRRNEPYVSNKKLQQESYGSIELPLYVIIDPDGNFVGTKTFTRNMKEYVDFLDNGLRTAKK